MRQLSRDNAGVRAAKLLAASCAGASASESGTSYFTRNGARTTRCSYIRIIARAVTDFRAKERLLAVYERALYKLGI